MDLAAALIERGVTLWSTLISSDGRKINSWLNEENYKLALLEQHARSATAA